MYTLMDFFRETISRPLRVLRPKICTHARDWQRLTSTHPKGDEGPSSKNRENLKFALKFSVLESITSGIVGVFSVSLNFFMRPAITARGISSCWNWFCTRTCGAGRPHFWLCHARLVFFRQSSSKLPRRIALKLCHMIRTWLNFIIPLQKFGGGEGEGAPPKKFGCQKMQNFVQFWTTSYFDREYLGNAATYPKSERRTN